MTRRGRSGTGARAARALLHEAILHLVITKGVEVANVTYLGRAPNAAQRIALLWQMPGWDLAVGTGRRPMVPPDHPDHPENRPKPSDDEAA